MKTKIFLVLIAIGGLVLIGMAKWPRPVVKVNDGDIRGFRESPGPVPSPLANGTADISKLEEDIKELKTRIAEQDKKLRAVSIPIPSPTPTVIYFEPYHELIQSPVPSLSPSTTPTPSVNPPVLKIMNCQYNMPAGRYVDREGGLTQLFAMEYKKPINKEDYEWFTPWAKPPYYYGSFVYITFNFYGEHVLTLTDKYGQKDQCWINLLKPE